MENLKSAVVFAILMENGEGILGKSQGYVLEKLRAVQRLDDPAKLLDIYNQAKLREWEKRWMPLGD